MIYNALLRELLEELNINPDKFTNLEARRLTEICDRHFVDITEPLGLQIDLAYESGRKVAEAEHKNDRDEGYTDGQYNMYRHMLDIAREAQEDTVDENNEEYTFYCKLADWLQKNEEDFYD